jgi:hypothetical protein
MAWLAAKVKLAMTPQLRDCSMILWFFDPARKRSRFSDETKAPV